MRLEEAIYRPRAEPLGQPKPSVARTSRSGLAKPAPASGSAATCTILRMLGLCAKVVVRAGLAPWLGYCPSVKLAEGPDPPGAE